MYRIYFGDMLLYDPYSPDEMIYDVSCYGGINDKGSMTFTMPMNHPLYNKIGVRDGGITVKHDDVTILDGYVHSITENFERERTVTVYGDLAYLGDVYLRPYNFTGQGNSFLEFCINQYNKYATRKFRMGINEAAFNDPSRASFNRISDSRRTVADILENDFLETYGGYVYITYTKSNVRELNYVTDVSHVNAQVIDFGVNIVDFVREESSENLYTAIIGIGAQKENKDGDFPESATEYITLADHHGGGLEYHIDDDVMVNNEAVALYGYREYLYNNSDITSGDELAIKCQSTLKRLSRIDRSIIVKAIDLSLIMGDKYKHLAINDIVRIRSKPHDIDEYMVVTEIDIDLDNPENTEFTLGVVYNTLTGEASSKLNSLNANLNKTVDEVDSIGEEAKEASKKAGDALNTADEVREGLHELQDNLSEFENALRGQLEDLKDLFDGAIMTWFYPYPPADDKYPTNEWETEDEKIEHLGDLFYDTHTGYCYRYMVEENQNGSKVYSWSQISDTDITKALEMASQAKDTADAKRRIFYREPNPPYDAGDLWCQGESGDILVAMKSRSDTDLFTRTDWEYASKYNDAVYAASEQYYQSESQYELKGGEWSDDNRFVEGRYTWQRTLITYGDGSQEYSPDENGVCISGNDGSDGLTSYFHVKYSDVENPTAENQMSDYPNVYIGTCVDYNQIAPRDPREYVWARFQGIPGEEGVPGVNGTDGKTSYLHIAYADSADGKTGFSVSDSTNKLYIGQYTDFERLDSTDPDMYSWTLIKGADGEDGKNGKDGLPGKDGVGIDFIENYYAINNSGTDAPADSAFSTTFKSMTPQNRYLWNYERIIYTDASDETTAKRVIGVYGQTGENGKDGTNGTNGVGIRSITEYYLATSAESGVTHDTSGWTTDIQKTSDTKKYLWNYEKVTYTDNNVYNSPPVIIGIFAKDGKGIKSTAVTYQLSDSGTVIPTGTWLTSPPAPVLGKFMWTRIIDTYTDDTTKTRYDISYFGTNGKDGTNGTNGTNGKDGEDGHMLYATCPTGAATADKVATLKSGSLILEPGATVSVYFTYANTADKPRLNVSNTGLKPIMTNGVQYAYWSAGQSVLFTYSGDAWQVSSAPVYSNEVTVGNSKGRNVHITADGTDMRWADTTVASFGEDIKFYGDKDSTIYFGYDPANIVTENVRGTYYKNPRTIKSSYDAPTKTRLIEVANNAQTGTVQTSLYSKYDDLVYTVKDDPSSATGIVNEARCDIVASETFTGLELTVESKPNGRQNGASSGGMTIGLQGQTSVIRFNGKLLLDWIYPVGSVYMSFQNTSPAAFLGGTWTKLTDGRFPRFSTDTETGGSTNHSHTLTGGSGDRPNAWGQYEVVSANSRSARYAYGYTDGWYTNYGLSNAGNIDSGSYYTTSGMKLGGYTDDNTTYLPPYQNVHAWRRTA